MSNKIRVQKKHYVRGGRTCDKKVTKIYTTIIICIDINVLLIGTTIIINKSLYHLNIYFNKD